MMIILIDIFLFQGTEAPPFGSNDNAKLQFRYEELVDCLNNGQTVRNGERWQKVRKNQSIN